VGVLGSHEVAVWCCRTESLADDAIQCLERILNTDERERRDRFLFQRDRRDFACAHGILRNVLSRYGVSAPAEWRFRTEPQGKPSLVPEQAGLPPLAFNLSHTHGFVACAVARGAAVGIDVERCERVAGAPDIAERYFAGQELECLRECGQKEYSARFIELWTLKESYLKATGAGLTVPLNSFALTFEGRCGLRLSARDTTGWQFWLASCSADVRLAVAINVAAPKPRWRISFNEWRRDSAAHPVLLRWSHAAEDL
jgi:4'-phosphopantetheinyl transferase